MRQASDQVSQASVRRRLQDDALSVLKSLLLVGITTIALLIAEQFFSLRHLILVYLVPVVIVATNLGMVPAVIAVIASGGATVFLFYPPIYSFLIEDPQHLVELLLFGFVAIVTGLLATNLKRQADLARRRETEVRELYTFSRRSPPTRQATSTPLFASTWPRSPGIERFCLKSQREAGAALLCTPMGRCQSR
jgi:K+-sensing histidine kinase KdpD